MLRAYAKSHGPTVEAPAAMGYAMTPLVAFFNGAAGAADPTAEWPQKPVMVADLTYDLCKLYWDWRREFTLRVPSRSPEGTPPVILEGGVSDGTIIRELAGVLRPALKHAIGNRLLTGPAPLIQTPSQPQGRDFWITRPQAAKLLSEARSDARARDHLPLFILIALYTGARRGAILDLTWSQIDFIRGHMNLNPPGRQQTKKRRPIVPIHPKLLGHLRRAHRKAISPYVISGPTCLVMDDDGRSTWRPMTTIKTGFNSAAQRAGIPDCTPHTLRHTSAVWMAARGVPLRDIAGMLGHSESRTTELYAHHSPEHLRRVFRAFD